VRTADRLRFLDGPENGFTFAVPATALMPNHQDLPAITGKIAAGLAIKPEVFITHPVELKILNAMTKEELDQYAVEHGWRIVRRLGGRQIEFYNDASTRQAE
jgi:hypothetical protein